MSNVAGGMLAWELWAESVFVAGDASEVETAGRVYISFKYF